MVEIAESIDEFLAPLLLPGSTRAVVELAIVDGWPGGGRLGGGADIMGAETARASFGKGRRGDGAGLAWGQLAKGSSSCSCHSLHGQCWHLWGTHPGLLSSGVVLPEESLLKYVVWDTRGD